MVDLGTPTWTIYRLHMRHIGLLASQEVPVCLPAWPPGLLTLDRCPAFTSSDGPVNHKDPGAVWRLGAGVIPFFLRGRGGHCWLSSAWLLLPWSGGRPRQHARADIFDNLPDRSGSPFLASAFAPISLDRPLITTFSPEPPPGACSRRSARAPGPLVAIEDNRFYEPRASTSTGLSAGVRNHHMPARPSRASHDQPSSTSQCPAAHRPTDAQPRLHAHNHTPQAARGQAVPSASRTLDQDRSGSRSQHRLRR